MPVGKHCGFVQFVRKADAEKAIEQMQGFPIGGSRIRLSWGRSQYKAAQAAAQAAQTTALQAQAQAPTPPAITAQMTSEQAILLLQRLAMAGVLDSQGNVVSSAHNIGQSTSNIYGEGNGAAAERDEKSKFMSGMMELRQNRLQKESNFSPFSPDPNLTSGERNPSPPHSSRRHSPGFDGSRLQESKAVGVPNGSMDNVSSIAARPSTIGLQRYGSNYTDESSGRHDAPVSRPNSGSRHVGVKDHDGMHDLNGTLASLDLNPQSLWKTSAIADSFPRYQSTGYNTQGSTPSP